MKMQEHKSLTQQQQLTLPADLPLSTNLSGSLWATYSISSFMLLLATYMTRIRSTAMR